MFAVAVLDRLAQLLHLGITAARGRDGLLGEMPFEGGDECSGQQHRADGGMKVRVNEARQDDLVFKLPVDPMRVCSKPRCKGIESAGCRRARQPPGQPERCRSSYECVSRCVR